MKLVVTGSIAFDYLMSFPGKFTEHFLPEHMQRVSLSFSSIHGQAAGRLRAEHRLYAGAARRAAVPDGDGGTGLRRLPPWLEAAGVDTSLVRQVPDKFTASFFCSTDTENNQIASFYTGAMAHAAELSFRTVEEAGLVIVSPNDPAAMIQYAEECRTLGPVHLRSGPAVRPDVRRRADGVTGGRRYRQRLRVRADSAEDRDGRGGGAEAPRR